MQYKFILQFYETILISEKQ